MNHLFKAAVIILLSVLLTACAQSLKWPYSKAVGTSSWPYTSEPPAEKIVAENEDEDDEEDGESVLTGAAAPTAAIPPKVADSDPAEASELPTPVANEKENLCEAGDLQSPLNLRWKKPVREGSLVFTYDRLDSKVIDDGSHLKVSFSPGNGITVNGNVYELKEMKVQAPSEHQLSGKVFPVELQFLHMSGSGRKGRCEHFR